MDDLESKLGAIMGNPEMMEKIMALAQSMNGAPTAEVPEPQVAMPQIDLSMVQKLSSLAGKSNIDNNQKNLLQALGPYLNARRISKLERAMRAAKMAGIATKVLPNLTTGR